MSRIDTDALVDALAADTRPVRPLAPPLARAGLTLVTAAAVFAALILTLGDMPGLAARYAGREAMMIGETGMMLVTGILALCGAFALSVPGSSRRWLLAPLPSLAAWLALTGAGCYRQLLTIGPAGWGSPGKTDCLIFIVAASTLVGAPVLWRLSRARPIDPAPVALLGGLGIAALSAFLLQFFHPFAITVLDFLYHGLAVGIVTGAAVLIRRRALRPG